MSSWLTVFVVSALTSLLYIGIRLVGTLCSLLGLPFIQANVETLLGEKEALFDRRLSLRSNAKWMNGLRLAVDLINSDSSGSAARGRYLMRRALSKLIIGGALNVERAIARHPEILAVPVRKPVFITGVGRNGSTLLHNLLSCYPTTTYLTLPEMQEPLPLDTSQEFDSKWVQERQRQWELFCEVGRKTLLDLHALSHPVNGTNPEECTLMLRRYNFAGLRLSREGVYGSIEWLLADEDYVYEVYQAYKRELQLLLYYKCVRENKNTEMVGSRYVLKSFYHTPFHDVIRDVFPDAYIVRLHRDPVKTVASLCSLVETIHRSYGGKMSRAELGRDSLKWTDLVCQRMVCEGVPANTMDIRYEDLIYDPVGVCGRVAAFVGLEHSEEVVDRIRHYLDKSPRHKYGVHTYSSDQYGLSGTDIRKRLRQYCEEFKV